MQRQRSKEEEADDSAEEDKDRGGIEVTLNNLTIETAGTEGEAAEGLAASLVMKVEEDRGGEGEEGGDGTQRTLGALDFPTHEADLRGTTIVDARNGFNDLSRLTMMWTVRHRWPAGVRFIFNFYRHWAQLILRQPGEPSVTILSRVGVTQGDPLFMFLYDITLFPLAEELRVADPGLLSPFYADDVAFDGLARQSAQLLKILMKRGADRGYLPEPAKSLFISDTPGQEEAAKRGICEKGA